MTIPSHPRVPYAVVYDLEFTAWDGSMAGKWLTPGEFKEVVQIGAVKVTADFSTLEKFDCVVRPRVNPVLSGYLEKLTGITNGILSERGVDFEEALAGFVAFAGPLPIIAFGRDDLVLRDNIRLYGLKTVPALPPVVDIRGWLIDNGIDIRGLHACDVGPAAGVAFDGHTHDGLADAQSVAAGIKALMARGAPRPTPSAPEIFP